MRCSYTHFEIKRRFGVPPAKKSDDGSVVLTGCCGSVGILIRTLVERIAQEGGYTPITLSALSRIGLLIGKPLTITRKTDPVKKENELVFNDAEMSAILSLAAPPASELEINGGKLTREDYIKKDPTWRPEYEKYGQTADEVEKQKADLKAKRQQAQQSRAYADQDHARLFHIGLPSPGVDKKNLITRISLADAEKSGLLEHKNVYLNESKKGGLRIAICGGSCHNKTATKKFWGPDWSKSGKPVLKGDVLFIITGEAPLDIAEYMAPDTEWLSRFEASNSTTAVSTTAVPVPAKDTATVTVSNPKKRKSADGKQ